MHSEYEYIFYPMDGERKTMLFLKGYFGNSNSIRVFDSFEDALYTSKLCILAIPKQEVKKHLVNKLVNNQTALYFTDRISLAKTYIMNTKEILQFRKNVCDQCESYGSPSCFAERNGYCADDEGRDYFRDGAGIEYRRERSREIAAHRKNRMKTTCPV